MIAAWVRRAATLHGELAAIAEVDPRWWLLAGGAAVAEASPARGGYLASDADPAADTFLGYVAPWPADPIADAIARARAARTAVRELAGSFPDQPLAVTIRRAAEAVLEPSALAVAAFAIGDRCIAADLDDPRLTDRLTGALPPARDLAVPFVCISIGDDPLATARHAHRRAWRAGAGPWLGLGRAGELATVSTCHLVVDGYGHARLTSRLAALCPPTGAAGPALPCLPAVPGAQPLGVAWRPLAVPAPRALPLAYQLAAILHRRAGRPGAGFSPTLQIPVAPGARDDPDRRARRVVAAAVSLRLIDGAPEPYAAFEARARGILAREAAGHGLVSRLLAAARAAPAPLAWKRRGIGANRPRWLERFAEVIGGRACLSRIALDAPLPPTCAVSSPARMAGAADPIGGCVITLIDDGERAAITACGSGLAGTPGEAAALLDEMLAAICYGGRP